MTKTIEPTATTQRRSDLLALAAIAVTVILWASAFVAIRYVGREVTAGALALGRLAVASVLLGIFLLVRRPQARTVGRTVRGHPGGCGRT